jgi:hypothetical protein
LFHHTLADCQANAAARILVTAVQALKESEDSIRVLGLDPDPIVSHGERTPSIAHVGCNMDPRNLCTSVFYGVADQVLEQLG